MSGWSWGSSNNSSNNNNTSSSSWSWGSSSSNNNNNNNNNTNSSNAGWSWGSSNSNNNNNSNSNNNSSSWSWGSSNNNNNNNSSSSSSWSFGNSNTNNNNNNNNSSGWNFGIFILSLHQIIIPINIQRTGNNNNNSSSSNGWNFGNNSSSNNNNNNNSTSWNFNNNSNNNGNNQSWNFNTNSNNQMNGNANNVSEYNANNPKSVMNKLFLEYSPKYNNSTMDNPHCRFETILYNRVPTDRIQSFEKPPCVRTVLWDQFVSKNPDKQNLVPVAVRGYDELCDRGRLCLAGHLSAIHSFEEIMQKIKETKQREKEIKEKILEMKQVQINLSYRLLVVIKTYICKFIAIQREQRVINEYSETLTEDEKIMKHRLDVLMKETRNLHFVMAKVNVDVDKGYDNNKRLMEGKGIESEQMFVNEESVKNIFNFLTDQTKIIAYLSKTVQNDMNDLDVVMKGILNANSRIMM